MFEKIKEKRRLNKLRREAKKRFKENAKIIAQNTMSIVDEIVPSAVVFDMKNYKVDGLFHSVIVITDFPEYIANCFLNNLYKIHIDCEVSIHIKPMPISRALRKIDKELNLIETQIFQRRKEGVREDVTLLERKQDLESQQIALQHESTMMVTIYINLRSDELDKLKKDIETVQTILRKGRIKFRSASLLTKQAYQSISPLNKNTLENRYSSILGSPGAAKLFPFIDRSFVQFKGKPILWGYDLSSGDLIYFDIFTEFMNYNIHCAGPTGGGKTFLLNMLAARTYALGDKVIIIDPTKGDFYRSCKAYNGDYIKIGVGEPVSINICSLPQYDLLPKGYTGDKILNQHVEKLINYIEILAKGITVEEKGILNHRIKKAYYDFGINETEESQQREEKDMPTFTDIYKNAIDNSKDLNKLSDRLRPFIGIGTKESMFSGYTNVNLDSDFIVFDLSSLSQEDKMLGIHLINDLIWTKAFEKRERTHVFVDEMWSTLENDFSAKMSDRFARLARSLNISFCTTSQNFRDYIENSYGRSILANAECMVLLHQEESEIEYIKKFKNLTDKMVNFLLQADVGEGILFLGRYATAVKFEVSENEAFLYETNPQKLRKMGVL